MAPITRTQNKRKADDVENNKKSGDGAAASLLTPARKRPERRPFTTTATPPHCPSNEPLVQALHNLSEAMFRAQSVDAKNRFKGVAIRRAAHALAELEYSVMAGAPLAATAGPHKVPGVGRGTAAYIDEFLETGDIYDIAMYNELADKNQNRREEETPVRLPNKQSPTETTETTTKVGNADYSSSTQEVTASVIQINRAPVLTLWVTVVAEQEGFARDEALTYGRWVSGTLARSKGTSLGIYKQDKKAAKATKKLQKIEKDYSEHVVAFGHMKIPVVLKNCRRLAVQGRSAVEPRYVQDYLERSFGGQLEEVQAAMTDLARSLSIEDLKKRCYHLYEEFRPKWTGWGQKSSLHVSKIRNLSKEEEK